MGRVAVVAAGGAGISILRELIKLVKDADFYCIDDSDPKTEAEFFSFEELDVLIDLLSEYECVILTAGMGSSGGDVVVKIFKVLENVRKLAFVSSPFYFEFDKIARSRQQIGEILQCSPNFEGAIVSLNYLLDSGEGLGDFDRMMAKLIAETMSELKL